MEIYLKIKIFNNKETVTERNPKLCMNEENIPHMQNPLTFVLFPLKKNEKKKKKYKLCKTNVLTSIIYSILLPCPSFTFFFFISWLLSLPPHLLPLFSPSSSSLFSTLSCWWHGNSIGQGIASLHS